MINNYELYLKGIKKVLTKNTFPELKNKKVLVTGINGMIASAIIDILNYLNEYENYEIKIIGIVRNKKNLLERFKNIKNLEIIEQDISKPLEFKKDIDYIINAASNADPSKFGADPVGTIETNFIGTKNLLDFAKVNNVKRLLYVSSGEIYGQGSIDIQAFDENYRGFIDSTNPRSCYPIGKLSAETLCVSYAKQYNLEVVIARPSHTYGPTQKITDSRASSQFITDVINDKDIIMKSEGKQIRSYTYVLDCVTGILRILISGNNSEAYNIANKNSVLSIREMAEDIAHANNKKIIFELPTDSEKASYNPVTRSVLDGTKLVSIGWIPLYTFKEGIKETIDILKK